MPFNNTHIDKLAQDAFNASAADMSKQQQHWKQMQTLLQPAVNPASKIKRIAIAVAAIAASIIGFILFWPQQQQNIAVPTINNVVKTPAAAEQATNKTIDTTTAQHPVVKSNSSARGKNVLQNYTTTKLKLAPTTIILTEDSSIEKSPITKEVLTVSSFYNQLAKPAQQFEIDAATGGTITCAEGSTFVIPPYAFSNSDGKILTGKVQLLIEEFYKYSDMVAANVNTVSDGLQLVTGGMVKITALQNSSMLQLANGKTIQLSMPATDYDAEMRLFTGDEIRKTEQYFNADEFVKEAKTSVSANKRTLNWRTRYIIPEKPFDGTTNFLNMEDEPIRVRETRRKRIAKFRITDELPMSVEEARQVLMEKYGGYYDVIKVKKVKVIRKSLFSNWRIMKQHIGDSVKLTLRQALRWRYIDKKDSAFYANKIMQDSIMYVRNMRFASLNWGNISESTNFVLDSVRFAYMDSVAQERLVTYSKYNFTIEKLGWINCDKFYKSPVTVNFVINLPKDVDASKFVTQLVFKKIRSVMQGGYKDNQLSFANIPPGMKVVLVGLGESNGRVVSFMQPLTTGSEAVSITSLYPSTPADFKQQLQQLDL
jgi:hypothetical protein